MAAINVPISVFAGFRFISGFDDFYSVKMPEILVTGNDNLMVDRGACGDQGIHQAHVNTAHFEEEAHFGGF